MIDEHVPMPDRDGGSARMCAILDLLRGNGWAPALVALDGRRIEPYAGALARDGIPIATTRRDARALIRAAEAVWICRPEAARAWMDEARALNPGARIAYDMVDLHHVREARRDDVLGTKSAHHRTRERERAAVAGADVVVAVSEAEAAAVADHARSVVVVPTPYEPVDDAPGYGEREGLLFIGSFDHEPNVDAALWLVRSILPHLPDIDLTIAGSNPPPRVRALQGEHVVVRGYVPDLGALLRRSRVALAPLRFGAGLKAKVVQAFAYGLPVIATSVAAEGFGDAPRAAMRVEDDAAAFAAAAIDVYEDEATWTRLSAAARAAAEAYAPSAALEAVLRAVAGFDAPDGASGVSST